MTEMRKQLTELQFRTLVEAQVRYNTALEALREADSELAKVSALVLDSLALPTNVPRFMVDAQTQEIVVELEEKELDTVEDSTE